MEQEFICGLQGGQGERVREGELAGGLLMSTSLEDWDELLTVKEAAERIKCHEETIRRAYRCGALRVLQFGARGVRVGRSDLEAWIRAGMPTRIVA